MPENEVPPAEPTCLGVSRCAARPARRRGAGRTSPRGARRRPRRLAPRPTAVTLPGPALPDPRPTPPQDENPVLVVNSSNDLRLRQASIDVFTEYRLLVEDRYPDVYVLTTEILAEETPPPTEPRKARKLPKARKPRSKDRPRRRVR